MPVKAFGDLIAMAKAKPGELIYAHSGVGTLGHLAMELLTMQSGIRVTHVPYKGTGPALTDTIGGRTQFMISSSLSAAPHVRNNRLRTIAITSAKRSGRHFFGVIGSSCATITIQPTPKRSASMPKRGEKKVFVSGICT
jgi:tripartite-type tricarboxylate transporter receptor subunit TctC